MKFLVAIIGSKDDTESVNYLANAFRSKDIPALVCPATEPREILRWTMELLPEQFAACIFADTDGRHTASLTTALHPAIIPLVWCPSPADPAAMANILADTPALLCYAHDPIIPAQLVQNLLSRKTTTFSDTDADSSGRQSANIQTVTPSKQPGHDETDLAAYQQLETMMASPIKKVVKKEPVPIQKPGLDFSLPLRQLMTQGRKLAQKRSHQEVLGAHYLASLDESFISLFSEIGLTPDTITSYLSGFDSGEEISSEPVISDEVFGAVSLAKKQARASSRPCIQISDFLYGLLQQTESSVADILDDADLSADDLQNALAAMTPQEEACAGPFFNPSSLDQDSFYQFDSTQLRDVEERLRELPGFKKAAERVAESRAHSQNKNASSLTIDEINTNEPPAPTSPKPPDKPEILKITGDFPSVDIIEHTADCLLEGQLVAFPSDIMIALAADAANPAGVDRLRQTAELPDDKPLSILIDSISRLKHLVQADIEALEPLFDELWPGPLTLIFKSAAATGKHISSSGTVAIRQPADNTSLAILSMLGRPLAVTSWDKPKSDLTGHAAIILEGAEPVNPVKTTVVDLTTQPWQVLREGAIPGQSVLKFYS